MSTGHVFRKTRNGKTKYYVVVEQNAGPDGRRVRKSHGGFDRQKDAKQALNSILVSQRDGTFIAPSKQTVEQFLTKEWLPGIRSTIRSSTWDSYSRNIRLHVIPKLGAVPLSKLGPSLLNQLYAALATEPKPLAPRTIRYVHVIVHRALKDAVKWEKIRRNPADMSNPPRVPKTNEMAAWSASDLRTFLELVRGDRLHALYLLACTTGMRRGEVLGLRWKDVDLERGRISISQTLVSVAYAVQISEPKTQRSRRSIAIDPATLAALRARRVGQLEEKMAWGPGWTENGLVFTREDGSLFHPQSLSTAFEAHVKRWELPRLSFHGLRHTYATLALASGMKPWNLSDRLGHSSVAFTLQVYRHAIPADQDEAALNVAAFILGD